MTLHLLLVIAVGIVSVGVNILATDQAEISLEDIRYNSEDYLEIEANGTYNISAERELRQIYNN